jgi:hypothetical protein
MLIRKIMTARLFVVKQSRQKLWGYADESQKRAVEISAGFGREMGLIRSRKWEMIVKYT